MLLESEHFRVLLEDLPYLLTSRYVNSLEELYFLIEDIVSPNSTELIIQNFMDSFLDLKEILNKIKSKRDKKFIEAFSTFTREEQAILLKYIKELVEANKK